MSRTATYGKTLFPSPSGYDLRSGWGPSLLGAADVDLVSGDALGTVGNIAGPVHIHSTLEWSGVQSGTATTLRGDVYHSGGPPTSAADLQTGSGTITNTVDYTTAISYVDTGNPTIDQSAFWAAVGLTFQATAQTAYPWHGQCVWTVTVLWNDPGWNIGAITFGF